MRILFGFLIWAAATAATAQSDSEWLLGTAGEVHSGQGVEMQWSIGELITETKISSKAALTQGFHQPWSVQPTEGDGHDVIPDPSDLELNVFPNPVEDFVHISQPAGQQISVDLVTTWGQRLRRYLLDQPLSTLDLSHLAQATFFLRVYDAEGKRIKTFKIVKN